MPTLEFIAEIKRLKAEIAEAWSAGHLSATTEDVELMDAMKEKHKAEIDDQEDTISEAEDLIKQHWTDLQTAQAEIDRLMDENSLLASWQCLYTDGKQGIVCDDRGSQYCAKQDEIDELVEIIEFGIEANKSSNPAEWHRWFEMAEKCLDKHRKK